LCASVGIIKSALKFIGVYLHTYEDGIVFQNVGMQNSDAGELSRRKHTTFRTRRKFEIKKVISTVNTAIFRVKFRSYPE